jgi:hypothetical protein
MCGDRPIKAVCIARDRRLIDRAMLKGIMSGFRVSNMEPAVEDASGEISRSNAAALVRTLSAENPAAAVRIIPCP